MKIMICGSRDATPAMAEYAARCVERADQAGYLILTGDAPGIDATVCEAAKRLNAACFVYGIQPQPRNGGVGNPRSLYVNLNHKKHAGLLAKKPGEVKYTDRDQYLVRHADIVLCLWNQASTESGTYRVYEYALEHLAHPAMNPRCVELLKKVYLITFEEGICRTVSA